VKLRGAAARAGAAADAPTAGFAQYLEELRRSDPAEHELLLKDLHDMSAKQQAANEVRLPTPGRAGSGGTILSISRSSRIAAHMAA
jgi:hypothetical protein